MSLGRIRRFWPFLVGLGGGAVWLGCNALAGIELGTLEPRDAGGTDVTVREEASAESGDNDSSAKPDSTLSDAGSDTGTDSGNPSSAGDAGDGSTGVDANAPTFVCSPSPRPFQVASLENADAGRQFSNNPVLGVSSDQEARILMQVSQNGNQGPSSEAFRVYNVRWPNSLDSTWSFQGGGLMNAQTTPTGITAILQTQGYDGGPITTLLSQPIPANVRDQGSLPLPFPLTFPIGNFNGSATLLELALDDDFVILRPQSQTGSTYQSLRGSRANGPGVPATFGMSTQGQGDSPNMVQGGNSVYAVIGSDPTSDAGVNIYKLPADGSDAGIVNPSSLPNNSLLAGAFPSTTDATKIATFAATLVTVPTAQLSFYAGLVDATRFDSLQLSALTQGVSYGLHEVPVNKSSVSFTNDQLVMAGLSPVASDQGINFVWMDSHAHVLGQAVGDNRLYNTRVGIQTTAVAFIQSISGILASFYVAWVEEPTDSNGVYDVLYVDQVQCAAP
jgi:hypothetical protein